MDIRDFIGYLEYLFNVVDKLLIPRSIFQKILKIVEARYPIEACGVLAGVFSGNSAQVLGVCELKNVFKSPDRFWFDYLEWIGAILRFKERGLEYIGLFHSHDREEAILSLGDRQRMLECPGEIWLIVAYKPGKAVNYTAWVVEGYSGPIKKLGVEII